MKGLCQQWKKRSPTPIDKITVVKSLILPERWVFKKNHDGHT